MRVLLLCFIIISDLLGSQNLILNPSFSETKLKTDSTKLYRILPGEFSEIRHWYLPEFINYKKNEEIYGKGDWWQVLFFSSKDLYLLPKDRELHPGIFPTTEWVFKGNEGFVFIMNGGESSSIPVLQQKLHSHLNPGKYCLRFKYKFVFYASTYKRPPSLDVALSSTNLEEYYADTSLNVPLEYIKVSYKDSSRFSDDNTPWQQRCYIIALSGNEEYISIGSFRHEETYPRGCFYLDDVELFELIDSKTCDCDSVHRDLRKQYSRKFPLNKLILAGDSLRMFSPVNIPTSNMISPEAEPLLREIISFMQRNPDIKIQFREYSLFYPDKTPNRYLTYKYQMQFFGISEDRIEAKIAKCEPGNKTYCSPRADFTRIGFLFYKNQ